METKKRIDFAEVKRAAAGHWDQIYSALAPELSEAMETALSNKAKHFDCPLPDHGGGGKNDFRLFKDFVEKGSAICTCGQRCGIDMLMALRSWDARQAHEEVANVLWGEARVIDAPRMPAAPVHDPKENRRREASNRRVWQETIPLSDPDAESGLCYLNRRGIYWRSVKGMDETLRFHPRLPYYDEDSTFVGRFPALIARVAAPDGRGITVHRIYFEEDSLHTGKPMAKKMRAFPTTVTLAGATIPLGPVRPIMGVAEGIETALAVREATGLSVWSCYSDYGVANFHPPAGCLHVIDFADRDPKKAGEVAAEKLQAALAEINIPVTVFVPGEPGDKKDWNDVLTSEGRRGFVEVFAFIKQCAAEHRAKMQQRESKRAGL